jgi:hypothetical protein
MPRNTDDTLDWMLARGDITEDEYLDFYLESGEFVEYVPEYETETSGFWNVVERGAQAILDKFFG